jgi:hypothetical protein
MWRRASRGGGLLVAASASKPFSNRVTPGYFPVAASASKPFSNRVTPGYFPVAASASKPFRLQPAGR